MQMAIAFKRKKINGTRLACLSNAGYETVGMADAICEKSQFTLGDYDEKTAATIQNVLTMGRLAGLVDIHNPLDITPMAPDLVYAGCLQAQISCPNIDACIVGILPLTPAMKTLPPGVDPAGVDTILAPDALPALFSKIAHYSAKPAITTVDCGRLYDPLCDELRKNGVPCFKSVDSAMIAAATSMLAATITGPRALGRMWRSTRRGREAPSARAASTHSFSRRERNCARPSRAAGLALINI